MTAEAKLRAEVSKLLDHLESEGGSGRVAESPPEFDYYALDYLDFAELNLERHSGASSDQERDNELISCVSNLKRAIDCEIECFLSYWGLRSVFRAKFNGLDKKFAFFSSVSLFRSRSIRRFTSIRNKVEHEFRRPEIQDLEALFDLVTALVAILQNASQGGFQDRVELTFTLPDSRYGHFSIEYFIEGSPRIVATTVTRVNAREAPEVMELEALIEDMSSFSYFFRVLILLDQINSFSRRAHLRSRLATSSLFPIQSS
jgi:hypothetical protein